MTSEAQWDPEQDGDWHIFKCLRIGAPPLRFSGRCLDWRETDGPTPFAFGLFQRKKGTQVTVVLSRWHDGAWQIDSFNAGSIQAAISEVEAYCQDLGNADVYQQDAQDVQSLLAQMQAAGRLVREVRDYMIFAGTVLDRWMHVAESAAADPAAIEEKGIA